MRPGLFTELFFLDEATAMAAGHRPCFECRRPDAERYASLWNQAHHQPGRASAPAMDLRLHAERIDAQHAKITYRDRLENLPDGTIVRHMSQPHLVQSSSLLPWSFTGYGPPVKIAPPTEVTILTPTTTVAILKLGYRPDQHHTSQSPMIKTP